MSSHLEEAAARLAAAAREHRAMADRIDEVLAMISGLGVEPEAASPPAAATSPVASTPGPDTPTKARKGTSKPTGAHPCPECGRVFTTAQGLGGHKRVHRSDDPGHTCDVCGTTFLTRGSLAAHRHRDEDAAS